MDENWIVVDSGYKDGVRIFFFFFLFMDVIKTKYIIFEEIWNDQTTSLKQLIISNNLKNF